MFEPSSTKYTPLGAMANPNNVPAPGGLPVESRTFVATCLPAGVVSTILPLPAFTLRTSPFGATASPRGCFSEPPAVTLLPSEGGERPVRAEVP